MKRQLIVACALLVFAASPSFAVGGNIGILLMVVPVSDLIDIPAPRMGWIQLTGVGGLALGACIAAIASPEGRPVAGGMAIGSVTGLLTGVIWTSVKADWLDEKTKPEPEAGPGAEAGGTALQPPAESAEPYPSRIKLGSIELPMMRPTVFMMPSPIGDPEEPAILMFGVEGILD